MNAETPTFLIGLNAEIEPDMLRLAEENYTVGRAATCNVVVTGETSRGVSRLHAQIEARGPRYWLLDEHSANGTFVNGRRIREPHLLTDQDAIGLGGPKPLLRYQDSDRTFINTSKLHYDDAYECFNYDNQPLTLTAGQHRLMKVLYHKGGAVCSRAECYEAMRNIPYDPDRDSNALDRAVSKLRTQLRSVADDAGKIIVLERGRGYRLDM